MSLYCPQCKAERIGALGSYLQPWHQVRCDYCGKESSAGSWEDEAGRPLGDPFEPENDYRSKPPTVFLSYSHADQENRILKQLEDDLMFRAKVNVWIDSREVRAGDAVSEVVDSAIRSSDYFLFVISRNTWASEWANRELNLAKAIQYKAQRLRVITVLIDQNSSGSKSENLIDFTVDYESAFRSLCVALGIGFTEPLGLLDLGHLKPTTGIIELCRFFDQRLMNALHRSPEQLFQLTPRDFEKLIAEIFDGLGYEVELTKRTRDGGRDVIAVRKAEVELRYLIECKHPDINRRIGVRPVRELLGIKADEGASKAILATTAHFTRDAQLYFKRHRWELEGRDYEGIKEWIAHYMMRLAR